MTTTTLDPALMPVPTSARPFKDAAQRLLAKDKADAEKLERMNHWPEARHIWQDIHALEDLLRGNLLDRIVDELKETPMSPSEGS